MYHLKVVPPCTNTVQGGTRRYKAVQDSTRWNKNSTSKYKDPEVQDLHYTEQIGTYWYILGCTDAEQDYFEQYILVCTSMYCDVLNFFAYPWICLPAGFAASLNSALPEGL